VGSPRVDVVFCIWQCDKENHGWREGPPVTVLCQSFRSAGRAFTLRLNQFERKQEYCLVLFPATPTQNIGRFKSVIRPRSKSVTAGEPLPCHRTPRAKEDFASASVPESF
jgi:hypothetical protein